MSFFGWLFEEQNRVSARAWKGLAKLHREDLHRCARDLGAAQLTNDSLQTQVENLQAELLGANIMQQHYAREFFEMRARMEAAEDAHHIAVEARKDWEQQHGVQWERAEGLAAELAAEKQADTCVTCALDVPLSRADTMSIWAELQLRADNPFKRHDAETRVLKAAETIPTDAWRELRDEAGEGREDEVALATAALAARGEP